MKQRINIGLIGLGTVGTGVVNILQKECGTQFVGRLGIPVEVVSAAVRDLKRDRGGIG